MTPYALPYTGADWAELRDQPESWLDGYGFVEARLDELDGFPTERDAVRSELESWSKRIAPVRPILVWQRRPGAARIDVDTAFNWAQAGGAIDGVVVDIEFGLLQPELTRQLLWFWNALDEFGVDITPFRLPRTLIASFHDYDGTPPFETLEARALELAETRPTAVKIATWCESPDDAATLLRLSRSLATRGIERIVVGMGPHGGITRVASALWRDWLTYAPRSRDEILVEGQLTRPELDEIRRTLGDAPG